jgi:hypothetical protein
VSAHAWQGTCCQPEGACRYQNIGTPDVQVIHSKEVGIRRTGHQHMHGSCYCCLPTQVWKTTLQLRLKHIMTCQNAFQTQRPQDARRPRRTLRRMPRHRQRMCWLPAALLACAHCKRKNNQTSTMSSARYNKQATQTHVALARTCSPGAPAGCLSSCHPSTSQAHGLESQAKPEALPGKP